MAPTELRHVEVLVAGGGFSGLGAAIKLTQAGKHDFVVIERGHEVGGTWRDNTYPGAACDVPSHLYSYSFELNPNWSRSFSDGWEIQQYLRGVADKYHVLDKFVFDCELLSANWDATARRWVVETSQGAYTAKILVSAIGALCEPALPDIKGIDGFTGEVFHSARWNHDVDLTGKRVALIGTGASAIQLGPEIAKTVGRLDVYQRTAPWIMPRRDRTYSKPERLAYKHVPGLQRLARTAIYWGRETFVFGFAINPRLAAPVRKMALANIARGVKDPALRAAVTPNFQIGCKRILISNDWYPMLERSNVDLVTDGIAEIRGNTIVSTDGTERQVDAIIVATGFHVTDSPAYDKIKGADGRTLGEVWRSEGQQAYKGSAAAGFPNLFFIVGPNTGLGHNSMVLMIESQLNYLMDGLRTIDEHGLATVEVRRDAQDWYNTKLQQRMQRTIWTTGGCASWYLDAHGRNTTLWPGFTFTFRALTRHFDRAAYETTAESDRATLGGHTPPNVARSGQGVSG
ncbi:MAG TPA: NAD(P)/FAD-dependent oxidoreductase [Jatrophihabitantaceae bacterium]|jgi:cyclohexanone monooxygenase